MEEIRVSVVKFGDRKYLQMQYRDPVTGKKKTRSTKTANKTKAERAAAGQVGGGTSGREVQAALENNLGRVPAAL